MQIRLVKHAALAAAVALSLQAVALQPTPPAAPAAAPVVTENAIEHPFWAKHGMGA